MPVHKPRKPGKKAKVAAEELLAVPLMMGVITDELRKVNLQLEQVADSFDKLVILVTTRGQHRENR